MIYSKVIFIINIVYMTYNYPYKYINNIYSHNSHNSHNFSHCIIAYHSISYHIIISTSIVGIKNPAPAAASRLSFKSSLKLQKGDWMIH